MTIHGSLFTDFKENASQDPFSLFFMAVPMYVFYEAAIVLGRVLGK